MSNVKLFKKTDLIIVFILVLIAAAGFFAFRIFNSGEGSIVRITVDGTVYAEADLNTDADFDIPGSKKPLTAHFYGNDKKMNLTSE